MGWGIVHRKVRCLYCNYKASCLKWWIPIGIENRITPLVGEKLIWLSILMLFRDVQYFLKQF